MFRAQGERTAVTPQARRTAAARAARTAVLAVLMGALAGCPGDPSPSVTLSFQALGDSVDIRLVGVDPGRAERAAELIRADFHALDQDLNTWGEGSMSRVNRLLPTGEPFPAPDSVLPLVHLSQRYSQLSGGLFNPATGKLAALWGFNLEVPEGMRPPPDHAIRQLLGAAPSMQDVEVREMELRGRNRQLRLDFGPLVRAYAIDVAIARLRNLDIRDAQVQSGPDLSAIGDRGGRPWRVSIPRGSGAGVLATLNIQGGESLVTRAAHDRDWIHDGIAYHYILDPRSGRPARGTRSVSVVHPEATVAAAAAIALFVAGPDHWHQVAEDLGVRYVALVGEDATVHISPELRTRIEIVDRDAVLEVSAPLGTGGQAPPSPASSAQAAAPARTPGS